MVLASGREGDSDALPIRADARVLGGTLEAGQSTTYTLEAGRHAYLALAKGKIEVNGSEVSGRDGAAIRDVNTITITAVEPSEVVMVDSK